VCRRACPICARARNHVRATRRGLVQLDVKSPRAQDLSEGSGNRAFAWAACDERWVPRIHANELARERYRVAAGYRHRSTPV
jgi:hypothetical protein